MREWHVNESRGKAMLNLELEAYFKETITDDPPPFVHSFSNVSASSDEVLTFLKCKCVSVVGSQWMFRATSLDPLAFFLLKLSWS